MPAREGDLPLLALALAAATSAWLGLDDDEVRLAAAFVPAVAAMDDADREYRRAIEATLPRERAHAVLSPMASFRDRVHVARERARREIGELYRRYNRAYGGFDPLDPFVPPTTGLSHADATRVATIADNARAEVDALRAAVNDEVAKRLDAAQIEALVAAKRRRGDAFRAAIAAALENAVAAHPDVRVAQREKALHQLVRLADGWY
ncbi:MAG TPA: hypothetical protein VE591_01580 [Candidatus Acidoferrum sp.]|nr:hypothetical protein [Candidatus Acidoferrum sp.]